MTREEAKILLPIIQAWSEGKTIQWKDIISDGPWEDVSGKNAGFESQYAEFRVKPEPREFIIQKPISAVTTSDVFLYTIGKSNCGNAESKPGYETIRVREVI